MPTKTGLVSDFISRCDRESNEQASYGLKVALLELRDLGKRHRVTCGETHVEELIHYLDELAEQIHPKARYAVRFRADALQRRLEFRVANAQLIAEGLSTDGDAVLVRVRKNHQELTLEKLAVMSQEAGIYNQAIRPERKQQCF